MEALNVECPCGSKLAFSACHGAAKPASLVTPAPVVVARPTVSRRLDLAAGQNPREGFDGVDLWPGSKYVVDLQSYPWPFDDNSVLELHCSHYVEHIPMEYVDATGKPTTSALGKDGLFKFFDECYRILIPGGKMTVIVPASRNDRAFQDPTHRRFIPAQMFLYLAAEWRKINKLDHYNAECDFGVSANPTISTEFAVLHAEVQQRRFNSEWNIVNDWIANMESKKPCPPGMMF